ncbi:MAG: aminotransferase class III-fold pyridoxal phosphate-dependent enzyme [Betaproteobacteria bacterium]|nr:aminotransferase class III-fold pyridoxal phosphate-dependent enzyme [Betaproteobacteria bacterium]
MLESPDRWILLAGVGAVLLAALPALFARLTLSRAKHRSMAGHSKWSRRIARWMPRIDYGSGEIFQVDGAPHDIAARRAAAFLRLANAFKTRFPRGIELTARALPVVSDLQLTSMYRVPFPFSRFVRERLKASSFITAAEGNLFVDCDGNRLYDLTASYGVNVFGNDRYREWMAEGLRRTQGAGAVLGTYHPLLARNAARLAELSGMDEVSFHMSGTEAVMQAVRLARYHTGRRKLVRFCGSYHGWWGDAQPGAGNPHPADDTYTLADLSEATLRVLETRRDIACVLVNPIQALHPNATAPADSALIDSSRKAKPDRAAYAAWLMRLRAVCKRRGIAFIVDDVFTGFRLARAGAQEYFGVEADMVTYGKTLAGGYPIGAVAGKSRWMRRYKDSQPGDVNFARGTFHSHPAVMGAMAAFLDHLDAPDTRAYYAAMDRRWVAYAAKLKRALRGLPVEIEHLGTVFTLTYKTPSRYNWMLQFYFREQGLALPLVGTGRIIFSFDYTEADIAEVGARMANAVRAMQADGWWWAPAHATNRAIRRAFLKEMFARRAGWARGTRDQPADPQMPEATGLNA